MKRFKSIDNVKEILDLRLVGEGLDFSSKFYKEKMNSTMPRIERSSYLEVEDSGFKAYIVRIVPYADTIKGDFHPSQYRYFVHAEEGFELTHEPVYSSSEEVSIKTSVERDFEDKMIEEGCYEKANFDIVNKRYDYDPETGIYTFSIMGKNSKDLRIKEEDVEAMYKAYSRYGENRSIQDVARHFDMPREVFVKVKDRLGLVKDSIPYPPEGMENRSDEEVIRSIVDSRELRMLKIAESRIRRDKEKRNLYLESQHAWLEDRLVALNQNINLLSDEGVKFPVADPNKESVSVFWSMHDEHWGKTPYGDSEYTIKDQLREMKEATDKVVLQIKERAKTKNISEIVTIFGSDMFHVDSKNKTTLRGTPQDLMCSVGEMTDSVLSYFTYSVAKASEIAPVKIYVVSGNHDRTVTEVTSRFLSYMYKGNNRVTVDASDSVRKYHAAGSTLLVMHHGDYRPKDLVSIIENESKVRFKDRVFKRKIVISGHLHSFALNMKSSTDVIFSTTTSPSKADEWTYNNYGSPIDRQITLYYFSENGPLNSIDFVTL